MKIKVTDYLPDKEGTYETDLGPLAFMVHMHNKIWYRMKTIDLNGTAILNYKRAYPSWWENTFEK